MKYTADINPRAFSRRRFCTGLGGVGLITPTLLGSTLIGMGGCTSRHGRQQELLNRPADVRLRVEKHNLEIAPGIVVPTTTYNGQVPGPMIRLPRGRPAVFEIHNHTALNDWVHWHGLHIPSEVDGAMEEGTPPVPSGGVQRFIFSPEPAGTHWYHTHFMGHADLSVGAYTGQYGFFIVDDGSDPGGYDQEVCLAMHHWGAHWIAGASLNPDQPDHGLEVGYRYATMNDRMLGHGEPVRVRYGEKVLFRLLNASATEISFTHLPGHRMKVLSMDGAPVPNQREVEVLMLGPAERADVLIEMNHPGVWIMGSPSEAERNRGMGVVVEYAGARGKPSYLPPRNRNWDYLQFGNPGPVSREPDHHIDLRITRVGHGANGHDQFPFNGEVWPQTRNIELVEGRRYRLRFINQTNHGHPMHLHRHSFEVASYRGVPSSGLIKDVINIRPYTTVELDFTANNPGPTLLHCHQVKHQDFGLMALLTYAGDRSEAQQRAMQHKISLQKFLPQHVQHKT